MHRLHLTDIERQSLVYAVKLGIIWFLGACFALCLMSTWLAKPVSWEMLWRASLFIPIMPLIALIIFWLDRRATPRSPR